MSYYNGKKNAGFVIVSGGTGGSVTVDNILSTTSENPVENKVITKEVNTLKGKLTELENKGIKVDSELSETSKNPVENKVVTEVLRDNRLEITNLKNALFGTILSLETDSNIEVDKSILADSVQVGEEVYPIVDNTRALLSEIKGKTNIRIDNEIWFNNIIWQGDETQITSITKYTQLKAFRIDSLTGVNGDYYLAEPITITDFVKNGENDYVYSGNINLINQNGQTTSDIVDIYIIINHEDEYFDDNPDAIYLTKGIYGCFNFRQGFWYEDMTISVCFNDIVGDFANSTIEGVKFTQNDLEYGEIYLDEKYSLNSAGTIKDKLVITKNENNDYYTLKKVVNVGVREFTGNETWEYYGSSAYGGVYTSNKTSMTGGKVGGLITDTRFTPKTGTPSSNKTNAVYFGTSSSPTLYITFDEQTAISYGALKTDTNRTVNGWKAYVGEQYTKGTPIKIMFALATPTEEIISTTLTLEQVSEIRRNGSYIEVVGNDNVEYSKPTVDFKVICERPNN